MKNIKYIIFTVVLLSACKKTNHLPEKENNVYVYVVGNSYAVGTGHQMALYFKNGKFIDLKGSRAMAICLQDTNVYIAGASDLSYTAYWKNGIVTNIHINDISSYASASSIAVSGTDVYVGGVQDAGGVGYELYPTHEVYWKNGVMSNELHLDLPGKIDITNCSIAVDGADLYVAGTGTSIYKNDRVLTGIYWKNNHPVYLGFPGSTLSRIVSGMTVSGGIVYCVGEVEGGSGFAATYWKNTTPIRLDTAATGAVASCIAVSGSDVYVGGLIYEDQGPTAYYWKNGVRHKVADNAHINSIAVDGSDVYCAGYVDLPNNTTMGAYWKNGAPESLTGTPANLFSSEFTGIAVGHH